MNIRKSKLEKNSLAMKDELDFNKNNLAINT